MTFMLCAKQGKLSPDNALLLAFLMADSVQAFSL